MTSLALTRVRVRRKRLKPPPPSFWRALAWVVWDLAFIAADFLFGIGGMYIDLAFGAIQAATLIVFDWPSFRGELKAWRDQ